MTNNLTLQTIEEKRLASGWRKRDLADAAGMNYSYLLQVYMKAKRGQAPSRGVLLRLDAAFASKNDIAVEVQTPTREAWLRERAKTEGITPEELLLQLLAGALNLTENQESGTTSGTTAEASKAS